VKTLHEWQATVSSTIREGLLAKLRNVSVRDCMSTLLNGPGCNLGNGRGCPLVVHLQLVHGFRCYDNIAPRAMAIGTHDSSEREMSARTCLYSLYAWLC